MTYPGIGGALATKCGYVCKGCGCQIISTIPTERCESCHVREGRQGCNWLAWCKTDNEAREYVKRAMHR